MPASAEDAGSEDTSQLLGARTGARLLRSPVASLKDSVCGLFIGFCFLTLFG